MRHRALRRALISVGVIVADPYGRPTVRVNEMSLNAEVVAVAWPAGQHPIIIVRGGFLDCQDDECRCQSGQLSGPGSGQLGIEVAIAQADDGSFLVASARDTKQHPL